MKQFYILALLLASAGSLWAQSVKQVQWVYATKKIADKTYEVHMTATINGNYHIYAQDVGVEGPQPTVFTFVKNPLIGLTGKVKETGKIIRKNEEVWGGSVQYYEKAVDFIQVIKLKGNIKTNLVGTVEFMVCNESQCLPPSTVPFKVNIGG
ncbi:MAG: protein-disulfide reductase DsbD domain-containing protein [Bacteroidota bacterium]